MDYLSINKKLWNDKTHIHYDSEFYDVKSFAALDNFLGKTVFFRKFKCRADKLAFKANIGNRAGAFKKTGALGCQIHLFTHRINGNRGPWLWVTGV